MGIVKNLDQSFFGGDTKNKIAFAIGFVIAAIVLLAILATSFMK